jgi:hypothetical protein
MSRLNRLPAVRDRPLYFEGAIAENTGLGMAIVVALFSDHAILSKAVIEDEV